MRLIAVCDLDGSITTLMTMPTDGLRPSVPSLPHNQQEVELEVPEVSEDLNDAELHARLLDIVHNSRVDLSQKQLVRKRPLAV